MLFIVYINKNINLYQQLILSIHSFNYKSHFSTQIFNEVTQTLKNKKQFEIILNNLIQRYQYTFDFFNISESLLFIF